MWTDTRRWLLIGGICGGVAALLYVLAPLAQTLIPYADRQFVVMQSSANVSPMTVALALGRVQFALLTVAVLCLGAAAPVHQLLKHPALPLTILVIVLGVVYAFQRSTLIDGTRLFYLDDDAMITMRYARNAAAGNGIVWNVGERVEGYSNFLWMIVMAGVHLLPIPETHTSLVMALFNWGIVIGMLWVLQAFLRRLDVDNVWVFVACFAFAFDANTVQWASSGLEAPLLALLVLLAAFLIHTRRSIGFGVVLALIPLVRADAFVLAGVLGLCYLWQMRSRQAVIVIALATIPTFAHFAFRMAYYGDILPNTYYLKATGIDHRWLIGLSYSLRFWVNYLPLLLLTAALPLVRRELRYIIVVIVAQLAYVIYIGGDTFWFLRPLMPVIPLLYLGSVAALSTITATSQHRNLLVAVFALLVPTAAWGGQVFHNPTPEPNLFDGEVQRIATMIEQHLPPGTTISLEPAGNIPYFAEDYTFVDALGKNDAHIAHTAAAPNNVLIGHNKFDWDYVYGERQPDIVLASCVLPDIWIPLPATAQANIYQETPINGLAYLPYQILHPDFVTLYYPNRIHYLTPPDDTHEWVLCPFARASDISTPVWVVPGTAVEQITLEFDNAAIGDGWHPPDVWEDGRTVQWGGPEPTSTLYVPLTVAAPVQIELCLYVVQDFVMDGLEVTLNDAPLDIQQSTHPDCPGAYLSATHSTLSEQAFSQVRFTVEETLIPDEFVGNGDTRTLSVGMDWLRIYPSG